MMRIAVVALILSTVLVRAAPHSSLIYPGSDGRLVYSADRFGNAILDFSNCGFMGGGVGLPSVPVKMILEPQPSGDDAERIQGAIDAISLLPLDPNGFRGALLLRRGAYRIGSSVSIHTSGVVMRGEGQDEKTGTLILGTDTAQRPLVKIGRMAAAVCEIASDSGIKDRLPVGSAAIDLTDEYVPVNARSFRVANAESLKPGDTVIVSRNGNAAWIHELGTDRIKPLSEGRSVVQWKPFALEFDRVITAITGNAVSVDAPIACAIEQRWGGGSIRKFSDTRIEKCGLEGLIAISEYDAANPTDEEHATWLVEFGSVKNAWGRELTATHFYHGVALLGHTSKWCSAARLSGA